jgi:hypothetical protein
VPYQSEPHWSNRPAREDILMEECPSPKCLAHPGQWCARDMAEFNGCPDELALCAAGTPPSHQARKWAAQGVPADEIITRMTGWRGKKKPVPDKGSRRRKKPVPPSRTEPAAGYISPDEPAWAESERSYQMMIGKLEMRLYELQRQEAETSGRLTGLNAEVDQLQMRVRDLDAQLEDALRNMPCGYEYRPES